MGIPTYINVAMYLLIVSHFSIRSLRPTIVALVEIDALQLLRSESQFD